jgi:uncharacterized membrane protein YcaP (DUF421 family)
MKGPNKMIQSLIDVDWAAIFRLETPLTEIFARGTAVYLSLFLLLRLVLKREAGTVGITDLLVVVLLADAAQNAMAGNYSTVPDGLILVGTIVFWAYALNWLGYRVPFLQYLVHPRPLLLVKDGQLLRRNMRHELVTAEELMSQVRLHGADDLAEVKEAFIEGDGRISVILKDGHRVETVERVVN